MSKCNCLECAAFTMDSEWRGREATVVTPTYLPDLRAKRGGVHYPIEEVERKNMNVNLEVAYAQVRDHLESKGYVDIAKVLDYERDLLQQSYPGALVEAYDASFDGFRFDLLPGDTKQMFLQFYNYVRGVWYTLADVPALVSVVYDCDGDKLVRDPDDKTVWAYESDDLYLGEVAEWEIGPFSLEPTR